MLIRCVAAVAVLGLLAGCTSSGSDGPSPSSPSSSEAEPTAQVTTGPTTAATASACPFVSTLTVYNTLGQRLDRLTVLRSGGRTVGCRFYALQHPTAQCGATCLAGEHLPGPNQPVLEIVTSRYPTAVAAHNAFALAAQAGTDAATVRIGKSVPAVVYRTRFDPRDGGQDWACGFSSGTTRVLLRSDASGSNGGDREVASLAGVVLRAL